MTNFPYQDASLSPEARADDLVSRLSLEEKAGLMFHTMCTAGSLDAKSPLFDMPTTEDHLNRGISHLNLLGSFSTGREFAEFSNTLQRAALSKSRWGIPVTLSTDPRHAFTNNPATALNAGCFSQWPEHLGMAAIGDEARMEEYSDIVRQEYLAVGIRASLHPQADLATEPRWSRIVGGLGEDAELASRMVAAHVRGLQGPVGAFGSKSISACVKHFPGGGPQQDGLDPHFAWGADQVYPGGHAMFEYHLEPFRAAIAAGVRVVMPSYGKPVGLDGYEEVAMAFNRRVITTLLRESLGFAGVALSDWGIVTEIISGETVGDFGVARAWGVEDLSYEERMARALDAGIDQFGGEHDVDLLVRVVRDGRVPEHRIDKSVRLLLREKFALGLFDNPFVDADAADAVIARKDFVAAGIAAQKDAVTLLKNASVPTGSQPSPLLPLTPGTKVYLEGFQIPTTLNPGQIATSPNDADVAVIRLAAPYEVIGEGVMAGHFHHGSLEFDDTTLTHIETLAKICPVVVDIAADRPAVLGSINDTATAIMLNFGLSDDGLVDILFGYSPKGKLPFDMPRSDAAVAESRSDTPFDTKDAFYRFGHGIRYNSC